MRPFKLAMVCLAVTGFLLGKSVAVAGTAVQLVSLWTAEPIKDPAVIKYASPGGEVRAFRLYAAIPRAGHPNLRPKEVVGPVFVPNGPAVTQPAFWEMTAQEKGKAPESVKFMVIPQPPSSEAGSGQKGPDVQALVFVPLKQPKLGVVYRIVPAKGRSLQEILLPPYTISNADSFLTRDIPNDDEKQDQSYIDGNKALEPSLSFKSGKNSTADLKLFYGRQIWENSGNEIRKIRFQSMLDVEGTNRPASSGDYIAKVNGEIDFLYLMIDHAPAESPFHALWETGLNSRVESDQSFKNVNQTVGFANYLAFNGVLLQNFANALCLNGDLGGNAPSAILSVSYDLVERVKTDSASGRSSSDSTTDRVRTHLYWSTTILKELKVAQLWNDASPYDLSFVIDSGFSYDFRISKFTPDVSLSLELGPTTLDKSKPSLTLTYVNGKTDARFENYNAVLGGVKLPF